MKKIAQRLGKEICILLVAVGIESASSAALADDILIPDDSIQNTDKETVLFLQAYDLMENGKFQEAIGLLRKEMENTVKGRILISMLIDGWRDQYFIEGRKEFPPAEWEVDWLKCAAVIDPTGIVALGEMGGSPAGLVALEFSRKQFKVRDVDGSGLWVAGIGHYPDLEKCWKAVSEGTSTTKECLNLEASLRLKKGLLLRQLNCPPTEPSAKSIAKLPPVFEQKQ